MRLKKTYILFILFVLTPFCSVSQSLKGYVYSNDNTPIPYAHVYVKHTGIGTTTDNQGKYFLNLDEGDYEIVFSTMGFTTKTISVVVYKKGIVQNIWMEPSSQELQEIEVKVRKRDPAYDIIKSAIDAREKNFSQVNSYTCNIYLKAKELISEKELKKLEKEEENIIEKETEDVAILNPEEEAKAQAQKVKSEQMKLARSMNMVEMQMTRHFQYPNKVKEIRDGYETRGQVNDLFFMSADESLNFYSNLIRIAKLTETPLISPLHNASILSYKFKLEKTWFENNNMIYHIKVIPRKKGNSTFEGTIDIVAGSFAIRRVDLLLEKGGLLFYDDFRIQQEYNLLNDTLWMVTRQEFDYNSKAGKRLFTGSTIIRYDNFLLDVEFPKKFFSNELSVTTEQAYERDSNYWLQIRPEPLSEQEQKIVFVQDSIKAAHNKKEYLDSIDAAYNKITFGDIGLWGIGFFNREKERHIHFSGILGFYNPFAMGGHRIGPDILWFKRFKNKRYFYVYSALNYGFRNADIKGSFRTDYMYNPYKQARISVQLGRRFEAVQPHESFTGMMDRRNWVDAKYLSLGHSRELLNGLYLYASANIKQNSSLEGYKFGWFSDLFIEDNQIRLFDPYNLVSVKFEFRFTPFQKYMTEPYRKVVLGSRWPTFSLFWYKGIPEIFNSQVNYDYIEFGMQKDFKIGTMGTSTGKIAAGKFLNTKLMQYENYKIFPQSDRWFFSTPMQNQLQDTTLLIKDRYFEAHFVHHFNGALVNNIPFVKKLRIYTLAGGNYTYIPGLEYHYADFYFGLEKSIRIQRQRFRFGFYFVFGGSTREMSKPAIQFSINHYDKREKSWDY
ncbi:MAG: carboxypeptidase-like regulatory domain-containing protein [Bacteroidales bacterium]|nr:carboxypeptidase-like regulatory domain-containing protein [Bacteroidales bacterium]